MDANGAEEDEEEVKGLEGLRTERGESFVSETDAFYYEYDFLKQSKTHSNQKVHKDLNEFATSVLGLTNIFSFAPTSPEEGKETTFHETAQTGIMRVNCIDCLDRTNYAMIIAFAAALYL